MTIACSAVVPTYRRPELLARCLAALAEQTLPPDQYEVIIADDAATEETRRQVERAAESARCAVRYVPVRGAHGPAAARNAGWRAARGEIVAFTDDDCVPSNGWLAEGRRALERSSAAAAAGRVVMPLPDEPTDYELDAFGLTQAEFVTANCFCRRRVLELIGGFDERFTAAWREDSDLQFTLLERGCLILRAEQAVVVHPIRPAAWGVSLRQQRKTLFDALLRVKHPQLSGARIPRFPRYYFATVAALAAGIVGIGISPAVALAGFAAWGGLTSRFCLQRLAWTSHHPAHVAEMAVTSALIPPLSLYWHWRGRLRFRCVTCQGSQPSLRKELDHGTAPISADRAGGPVQFEMPDVLDSIPPGRPVPRSAGVHAVGTLLPDSGPVPSA